VENRRVWRRCACAIALFCPDRLDFGRLRRYLSQTFRQAVSFASRNGLPGPQFKLLKVIGFLGSPDLARRLDEGSSNAASDFEGQILEA
jgi:hypothetical protein